MGYSHGRRSRGSSARQGQDGHTLYKLACVLREDGRHTRDEAYELIEDADLRWGKFFERPDKAKYLTAILDNAGF